MVQSLQGVISTNNKHQKHKKSKEDVSGKNPATIRHIGYSTATKTKEIHIWDQPIIKLYTDDCVRFPIVSRSGNEYIMIAYHCDSNTILQAPFFNRKENTGLGHTTQSCRNWWIEDITWTYKSWIMK